MMPPSASKANVRTSIKKYLIDRLAVEKGESLFFDIGFLLPEIRDLTRWISVNFGDMQRRGMSSFSIELICATRGDAEGDDLASLTDVVFDVMTDADVVDGKRRIALYDISTDPWTDIGRLLVTRVADAPEILGPDKTKYQPLTCDLYWVAKI